MKFEEVIGHIELLDSGLKNEANKAVNRLLTLRNWLIGFYIVEYEQKGEDRAAYGKKVLENISKKIDKPGFSVRNLKLFRQFYESYPSIGQSVSAQLQQTEFSIGQVVPAQFDKLLSEQSKAPIYAEVEEKTVNQLSFSHITLLLRINDPIKRAFYAVEAIRGIWSTHELKRQIAALLYERSGMSQSPEKLLETVHRNTLPSVDDRPVIKDLYALEFLGLPQQAAVEESDLETALIDHLQEFIRELGHGFCFEARQKRILIGDEYFFIDLVFYHRILKCHILIELKVEEFSHANAGQLNTYLNYYKKEVQEATDNPPVGILLVTDKNEALVEYATAGMDDQLFVRKYMLQLPTTKKLEDFVRQELKNI
ncbi:putative nuclease of restriction endonuclease-like (RecB) superfamily [Roseivirga ehrenbergii]|uniref:Cytoplasmic protein n=1 Tax=Roseivirga ehrenbergii (strain DSM 102268 / JCM 13514 / KCTC 12282 / NCIMB 14502 / KMM 6017) TaxID=279360 RepID=A0A150XRI5_ROSEK|nr:PDDEXK nuclease domain-containing protein [Roseivirga ehrenbergii]KYG81367.1 cytoplasmic protein [Roseivirga ehrenbergii]TCL10509.1 putative nuclease of restriction endonuclease-like (RecB) superfamily [Roseivirga ehrenbergii]